MAFGASSEGVEEGELSFNFSSFAMILILVSMMIVAALRAYPGAPVATNETSFLIAAGFASLKEVIIASFEGTLFVEPSGRPSLFPLVPFSNLAILGFPFIYSVYKYII